MAKKKTSQKKEAAPLSEPMSEPISEKPKEAAQRDPSPDRTEKLKQLNEILLKQTVEKREQVSHLQSQIEEMGLDLSFISDTEREVFRVVLSAFVINLSIETHERLHALEVEKQREMERGRGLEERVMSLKEELKDEMEKKRLVDMEKIEVLGQLDMKGREVLEMGKIVKELERGKLELQEKISKVCDERDGLVKNVEEKEGLICNLRSEKDVTEKSLEESENLARGLVKDVKEKEGLICNLKSEKVLTEKRLNECEILARGLVKDVEEKEGLICNLKSDKVLTEKRLNECEILARGLVKDVKEKEGLICNLKSEKVVTEKRLEECEILARGLVKDVKEKEGFICNLKSEKVVTEKRLEECEILLEKLKIRIEEEIKDKESKLSLLGNEKEGLEKKVLDMETEHDVEARKLGSQIEGLKCKNTDKDREIGGLKATIDGKIENIEGLKREVEILQLAIEEAKKKGIWSWIYPAATTVLAAVSFVYATRTR
ncbi:hypothetical protein LUZ60_015581 [Juncus effusus]|nr:hypothetical protein LUZ60_015581 [Juncus effusus]